MLQAVHRILTLSLLLLGARQASADNWPQWRGPAGDGVSKETGLPLSWSEHTNIAWKCPLPGDGASSPIIWGDAIYLTMQDGNDLLLLKLDKRTGKVGWQRQVGSGEPRRMPLRGKSGDERREQKFHKHHNMASPTPATDGERVVVHFGNGDLAAYDFAGKQLWNRNLQKDHGTYTIWWGHANSPVLYKDLVISTCMQDSLSDLGTEKSPSYLVAHDKRTGELKWKTMRMTESTAEECDSYTTPIVYHGKERDELIVAGANQLDAYDPATGKQLWVVETERRIRTITGPTLAHDRVYYAQGFRGPIQAVRIGGEGKRPPADVVLWKHTQSTPDTPWPVVWKDLLFCVSDDGIAQCLDAHTGALQWKQRLPGDYKASPIGVDGRVYFLNLAGLCTVVAASAKLEKLGENQIDGETIASPVVSDGRIYLRSRKALYAIEKK
jgi:outer membrane protein assembly factor BamB